MIKDNLKNAESYHKLGEGFKKGFEFLKNTVMKNLENGKYQIEGDDIFVSVQDYTTKPQEQGKFEAHKKYADIQFIIKGEEKLGFGDVKNFKPVTFYDEKNDIIFLEGDGDFVNAKEGDFVIFMPEDAHMPCIAQNEPSYVKKAVVKVLLKNIR